VGTGTVAAGLQVAVEYRERDVAPVDVGEQGGILGLPERVVGHIAEQADGVRIAVAIIPVLVMVPCRQAVACCGDDRYRAENRDRPSPIRCLEFHIKPPVAPAPRVLDARRMTASGAPATIARWRCNDLANFACRGGQPNVGRIPNGLPDPSYQPTIGDRLDAAGVSWRWYAGGWTDALAGHPQVDPFNGGFQFHHQAFAYFANFAPFNADGTPNPQTNSLLNPNAHLQDEDQFFAGLAAGNLPAVSFIKPVGANNENPGYARLIKGQQHVASVVHAIQNSAEWDRTLTIVTYDENGGFWDHVAAP